MIDEKVFLGYPLEFGDVCQVYPPTVNDVIGNKDFLIYQSLFTMTQEDLDEAYAKNESVTIPTPFQYLLMNYYQDENMKKVIEDAFMKFVHEPVTIVPEIEMLLIGKSEEELDPDVDLENPRLLTEENFFDFQNMIRKVMGDSPVEKSSSEEDEESLDPRVRRYKAKMREREKILKRKKAKKSPTLGTLLAAICCMGIGLNPLNIGEISYACVHWLIAMEQQKEEYDIDIQALLAGADSKKVDRGLAYNIFSVYQRGHTIVWLTRNPQHVMVVGISWEDLLFKHIILWNTFIELLMTLTTKFILELLIILSKDGMNIDM